MKIIDTAQNVAKHLDWLKTEGCETVIRYLTPNTAGEKLVTPAEARAIASKDMRLALVFEIWGGSGRNASFEHGDIHAADGKRHGEFARDYAPKVGAPDGTIIWFAVDTDVTSSQYASHVAPYLAALRQALAGKYRVGLYSNGLSCRMALDAKAADAVWLAQSTGWAEFRPFRDGKRWALLQGPSALKHGLDFDPDEPGAGPRDFLHPEDYGSFTPFAAAAPKPADRPTDTDPVFPKPTTDGPKDDIVAKAVAIAAAHPLRNHVWNNGSAPRGYVKGMAAAFAIAYAGLRAGDPLMVGAAIANTGNDNKDAISWYNSNFRRIGLTNDTAGADTFRHLCMLAYGLGLRESGGKFCEGRDTSADNKSADNAEAGLFQTSFDAPFPEIRTMLSAALAAGDDPEKIGPIFHEGVVCRTRDLQNFGSGPGADFQRMTKASPMFAFRTVLVGLRKVGGERGHWGPIRRKEAELVPLVDDMFAKVQAMVDATLVS